MGVFCLRLCSEFKNIREKFFDFWRLKNFLRKSRHLKKMKYLRKDLWLFAKTLSSANYCLYLPTNSLSVTFLLVLYFVVLFVPIILKILLYYIKDKLPRNYKMRCELWTGFCSKFPEQSNSLRCLKKKEFIISASMEKCRNTDSGHSIAYFKNTNCDVIDNSS